MSLKIRLLLNLKNFKNDKRMYIIVQWEQKMCFPAFWLMLKFWFTDKERYSKIGAEYN